MVGVDRDIVEHNLNITTGSTMIKQKRRGQVGEHKKAINHGVEKLTKGGILCEVVFPSLITDTFMVKSTTDLSECAPSLPTSTRHFRTTAILYQR